MENCVKEKIYHIWKGSRREGLQSDWVWKRSESAREVSAANYYLGAAFWDSRKLIVNRHHFPQFGWHPLTGLQFWFNCVEIAQSAARDSATKATIVPAICYVGSAFSLDYWRHTTLDIVARSALTWWSTYVFLSLQFTNSRGIDNAHCANQVLVCNVPFLASLCSWLS